MPLTEAMFQTHDDGQLFDLIEDESGDAMWGWGHVNKREFVGRGTDYEDHMAGEPIPAAILYDQDDVSHVWAVQDPDVEERFNLVPETTPGAVPITRMSR